LRSSPIRTDSPIIRRDVTSRAEHRDVKYGTRHRAYRRVLARDVAAGRARCSRCGELIEPGESWDLGHVDGSTLYAGPEHRRCNRATAAHRLERELRWTSREW
jgi:ribosomal protein L24E